MEKDAMDSRLRLIQHAPLSNTAIRIRVDHNVVKKGAIKDPYPIETTLGTLYPNVA